MRTVFVEDILMLPHVTVIEETRALAYRRASCIPMAEHNWVRFMDRDTETLLWVLCSDCGRTPAEALLELRIVAPASR